MGISHDTAEFAVGAIRRWWEKLGRKRYCGPSPALRCGETGRLRQYLEREPFRAFVVQLYDGRRLEIRQRPVVFCDGATSYIDPADGALVAYFHDEVGQFGALGQEIPE